MDEKNAVIFQPQFLERPFHGGLAVLVFVDAHGCRYPALFKRIRHSLRIRHVLIVRCSCEGEQRWRRTAVWLLVVRYLGCSAMHVGQPGKLSEFYENLFMFLFFFMTIFGVGVLLPRKKLWCPLRYGIITIHHLNILHKIIIQIGVFASFRISIILSSKRLI